MGKRIFIKKKFIKKRNKGKWNFSQLKIKQLRNQDKIYWEGGGETNGRVQNYNKRIKQVESRFQGLELFSGKVP